MKNLYTTPKLRLSLFATENVMTLSSEADSKLTSDTSVKSVNVDMADRVQTLSWENFNVDMGN